MWLIDPNLMCPKHRRGEHLECHMFNGCLAKRQFLYGYTQDGLFDPRLLKERHDQLVPFLNFHDSPLDDVHVYSYLGLDGCHVDVEANVRELSERCPVCKRLIEKELAKCT